MEPPMALAWLVSISRAAGPLQRNMPDGPTAQKTPHTRAQPRAAPPLPGPSPTPPALLPLGAA